MNSPALRRRIPPRVNRQRLAARNKRAGDNAGRSSSYIRSGATMSTMTQNAGSGSVESHVDRARRGPTPDNPSLSLKKRLKRAAFFDQRDRLAAEGKAVPVDAAAGLPQGTADEGFMLQPDAQAQDDRHWQAA